MGAVSSKPADLPTASSPHKAVADVPIPSCSRASVVRSTKSPEHAPCLPQHASDPAARYAQLDLAAAQYAPCKRRPGTDGGDVPHMLAYPARVPQHETITGEAANVLPRLVSILYAVKSRGAALTVKWHAWRLRKQHAEKPFAKHVALVAEDPPEAAVDHAWRSDYFYGHQRLHGVLPFAVRRCDRIPPTMADQLAADDGAALTGLLPNGETLASLVAAKRVFIVDHSDLEGCPVHEGRYLCPSRTLFLATGAGDSRAPPLGGETIPAGPLFRPIAIQLAPEDTAPVITPVHPPIPGLWLAARTHAAVTDMAVQVFFEHVGTTHLCNEAFWLCVCRTMADAHPLKQILKPHMHNTLYIGEQFRDGVYGNAKGNLPQLHACGVEGGWAILSRRLARFKLTDHDYGTWFAECGTDELEGYPMHDDAKAHFALILKYCRRVVDLLYPQQPLDIHNDHELQALARELRETGGFKGVPGRGGLYGVAISTAEEVARLIALPISVAVIKHSLMGNRAFEVYSFAPNSPLSFTLPPPVSQAAIARQVAAGGYTDEVIAAKLPQGGDAALQYALAKANRPVHPAPNRIDRFTSIAARESVAAVAAMGRPELSEALAEWIRGLDALEGSIAARNATTQHARPFVGLLPSDMSNSIWD